MAEQALEQPKAYSYRRFSTPEQGKGDSLRRQTEAAQAWADKRGVALDTEQKMTDEGVSAYAGANTDVGALGAFKKAAQDGKITPGSWLLVESLDRISRAPPIDAAHTMQEIIRAGVTVVDLSDNAREYNLETLRSDNGMGLMVMVMMFARANNESAMKGMRVAGAFENKRQKFASGETLDKPYTRRLPAWLRWDDATKAYELIEERAQIVRKMFELTEEGCGQHRIAQWLNAAGVETWGAGGWRAKYWHRSYVRKILSNPATVGTFVPHRVIKKVRTPLAAIHNRLPAAVDPEIFARVADKLTTTGARGRNASRAPKSIFAGVLKCQHCEGTVTRVSKGAQVYLVCSAANARARTCQYESVPYQEAEDALCRVSERLIDEAPRGKDTTALQESIAQQLIITDVTADRVQELLNIRIADKSAAARKQLQQVEKEHEEAEAKLLEMRTQLDRLTTVNVAERLQAVADVLGAERPLDVVKTNAALRQAMRKMVMKPAEGELLVYWHHAEEPQEVSFHTRRFKWDRKQPWETEGNA